MTEPEQLLAARLEARVAAASEPITRGAPEGPPALAPLSPGQEARPQPICTLSFRRAASAACPIGVPVTSVKSAFPAVCDPPTTAAASQGRECWRSHSLARYASEPAGGRTSVSDRDG